MFSLILPTFNEAKNLPVLLPTIEKSLEGIEHEIIIVDDNSPDRTWEVAEQLSLQFPIRTVRRISERGLATAVIRGFEEARGEVLGVMDADGQHDTAILRTLYDAVNKKGGIAVGSRYMEGGSVGEWNERRQFLSRLGTNLAMKLCRVKSSDPMSGLFAVHSSVFHAVRPALNPIGYKILLDFLVHVPNGTPVTDIPFTFGTRIAGESKLSLKVNLEFLQYLLEEGLKRVF